MTESAPAKNTSQPSQSTQMQHDDRNDETAGDESAPLLDSDDGSTRAGLSSPKAVYVLTSIALSFSALCLVFLIASQITLETSPQNFQLGWQIQDGMRKSIAPAILSLLISALSLARLRRKLSLAPLFIHIIADILIGLFGVLYGAVGLAGTDSSYCYSYSRPYDPHANDRCMLRALPARILGGIALGSAVVFGTAHLALFVVRCIIAYRAKAWKGPWRFPDGQLTVELSLKLFKEPQKPREAGAEAV